MFVFVFVFVLIYLFTGSSRMNSSDVTDPGGRLGPYKGVVGDREPDLRYICGFLEDFGILAKDAIFSSI